MGRRIVFDKIAVEYGNNEAQNELYEENKNKDIVNFGLNLGHF